MPNQRDIAKALGLNQATVSLALRGSPTIRPGTRQQVRAMADKLGYRPNAYVTTLMSHIRAGRKLNDQGAIAVIVEAKSEADWHQIEAYRLFHRGLAQRASGLGFQTECFFLGAQGMSAAIINRILIARGVRGVVLAPPYRGNRSLAMNWDRYACVGTGYGWEPQQFDRVASYHAQNVLVAFQQLDRAGYLRIGMSLPEKLANGTGVKWFAGFLEAQSRLLPKQRVPLFTGGSDSGALLKFRQWYRRWQPDVLLTLIGQEKRFLDELRLEVPKDIGLACLACPAGLSYSGVDEKYEVIGAKVLEMVAAQIALNEYGLPTDPKLILIEGQWVEGNTLVKNSRK